MLEMIDKCNWTRPVYVATTVGAENYMNLGDNFIQEGLANRITPFTTNIDGKPVEGMKSFDTEKTFDNIMHKYKFGGIDKPGIYLDETVMRMCFTHRRLMSQLASHLIEEGKTDKAKAVLAKAEKEIPGYNVPHDFQSGSLDIARAYVAVGEKQKAQELLTALWKKSSQYMQWYCSLDDSRFAGSQRDCMLHLYLMNQMLEVEDSIDAKKSEQMEKQLQAVSELYYSRGGSFDE